MAITDFKLTEFTVKISALPDTITQRAAWLKAQFDARGDELRDKYNQALNYIDNQYYTKEEVDRKEIAASTGMPIDIYDTERKGLDVYNYAEQAAAEAAGTVLPAEGDVGSVLHKTADGVEWRSKVCVSTFVFDIPASGWSATPEGYYKQTVPKSGVKSTFEPWQPTCVPYASTVQDYEAKNIAMRKAAGYLYKMVTADNQITFYALKQLDKDLKLKVQGVQ